MVVLRQFGKQSYTDRVRKLRIIINLWLCSIQKQWEEKLRVIRHYHRTTTTTPLSRLLLPWHHYQDCYYHDTTITMIHTLTDGASTISGILSYKYSEKRNCKCFASWFISPFEWLLVSHSSVVVIDHRTSICGGIPVGFIAAPLLYQQGVNSLLLGLLNGWFVGSGRLICSWIALFVQQYTKW